MKYIILLLLILTCSCVPRFFDSEKARQACFSSGGKYLTVNVFGTGGYCTYENQEKK